MATYSKQLLSGSTNGRSIAVSATATPGTLIHTATSVSGALDEIWLYADNNTASPVKLTVEFGGATTADQIEITIAGESGLILISPGLILNGGTVVRSFCGTSSAISVVGYVNRIS